MNWKTIIRLSGALLATGMVALAAPPENSSVLTNNPGLFDGEAKAIRTETRLRFLTDGPFATDPEMLMTGSRPNGECRALIDGGLGWAETMSYHTWGGGTGYAAFVIEFDRPYLVAGVGVWSVEDEVRSVESFEVLLSADGEKFVSMGSFRNDGSVKSTKEMIPVGLLYEWDAPALARAVEVRVRKNPGSFQMVLGDVAIWGEVPHPGNDTAQWLPENRRPRATFAVDGIQEGAARLDWSKFAAGVTGVKNWFIYQSDHPFDTIDETGVALIQSCPGGRTDTVVYPLQPGHTYYWGIAAEYEDGSYPFVAAQRHDAPLPFQCDKFGDMLAINHYWGGGGARGPARRHAEAWEQVALDLLAKTPFKQTRWWVNHPAIVEKLYENGLGLCAGAGGEDYSEGVGLGIFCYSAGNEPDISGRPMQEYNDRLRRSYAIAKRTDPAIAISAPTCGLEDKSLEWLDAFYRDGMKDYFDVMDVHSYTKVAADYQVPEGYPPASPEALFNRVAALRAVMARHGDADKPMISTEFGYTDSPTANPSGKITAERKAEFLIRGLILHYVLGFNRVYVYAFWDEGEDFNYTEHFFGMVDYNMQVKPAYTASVALGEVLGDCTTFEAMPGAALPDIGYNFHNPVTGKYVAVVWNGAQQRAGKFATAPGKVEIVSLYGDRTAAQTDENGGFRQRFGHAPVYLIADAPVRLLEAVDVAAEATAASRPLTLTVADPIVAADGAEEIAVPYELTNTGNRAYVVKVTLETRDGAVVAVREENVAAGTQVIGSLPFRFGQYALEQLKLNIGYEGEFDSFFEEQEFFVRRLSAAAGVREIVLQDVTAPVVALASDTVELVVDPARGGRVLEFFDRKRGGNQLMVDYAKMATLPSVPFAFCIWDRLTCDDPAYTLDRETVYRYELDADSITMRAGAGLEFTKRYQLCPEGRVVLSLEVTNRTAAPQCFRYYLHPEYTVGGSGDSVNDELTLPIAGEMVIPFWTGLGEKSIDRVEAGWWQVTDRARNITLRQRFDHAAYKNPRLWFGIGAYNLEMETVDLTLAPGQSWRGELEWQLQ